jgi:hypothetical protein
MPQYASAGISRLPSESVSVRTAVAVAASGMTGFVVVGRIGVGVFTFFGSVALSFCLWLLT